MNVAAFWLIAVMLAAYVMLDGYDLGVAAITPFVARTDRERLISMQSIGPFWNGNEVWLLATGGTLFALFPKAYASAFSGFYLPLIVVLWLLMFRGIALELRDHSPTRIWHEFWDASFAIASTLLILVFGISLGNLLRGVPLDASGYFQGTFAFLLNPYAILVGVFAIVTLAMHGAAFLRLRVDGLPAERARTALPWLWLGVTILYVAATILTIGMHGGAAAFNPLLVIAGFASLGALAAARVAIAHGAELATFLSTSGLVLALLVAAAGTLYPYLLAGYPPGTGGITIFGASPSPIGLMTTLIVTIAGLIAVVAYSATVWRRIAGKIAV
jgi:cytochrome bd ubiquinol oxidase subunit II